MLEAPSPITEAHTFNNFTMKEKTPVVKINLRGNPNNKDFSSKVGKILGTIDQCTVVLTRSTWGFL